MLPKADSSSFVLFSLLFVLTLTDPPQTGKLFHHLVCLFSSPVTVYSRGLGVGETDWSWKQRATCQAGRPVGLTGDSSGSSNRVPASLDRPRCEHSADVFSQKPAK